MKFYDEEKLCIADILFWGLFSAIIFICGYGLFNWFWDKFSNF